MGRLTFMFQASTHGIGQGHRRSNEFPFPDLDFFLFFGFDVHSTIVLRSENVPQMCLSLIRN